MPVIQFDVDAFGDGQDPVRVEIGLLKKLEVLIHDDLTYIDANPATPTLYTSGVRYLRDPEGVELWKDVAGCLRDGVADCKSLAAYRAAELRRRGERATLVLRRRQVGNAVIYHVQVQREDKAVEDPSSILGMMDPWAELNAQPLFGPAVRGMFRPSPQRSAVRFPVAGHRRMVRRG